MHWGTGWDQGTGTGCCIGLAGYRFRGIALVWRVQGTGIGQDWSGYKSIALHWSDGEKVCIGILGYEKRDGYAIHQTTRRVELHAESAKAKHPLYTTGGVIPVHPMSNVAFCVK